jgi:Ni,Fe-hydrogenase III component G
MTERKFYTTEEKVRIYEKVIDVFNELFKELKDLGKKKPEQTLSSTKVKIINRVLIDVMECLEGQDNHKYLQLLEDDDLPQFGDAILILSQFEGALTSFRDRHHGFHKGEMQWIIK